MNLIEAIKFTKSVRERQYQTGKVTAIDFKYLQREKQLYISAQNVSADKSKLYKTSLVFDKIQNSKSPAKEFPIPYSTKSGVYGSPEMFLAQPTVSGTMRSRCSCQDYYFMWGYWNKKQKSLIGAYKPYTRVSPPSGRPPVNPDESPGLCKHLLALIKQSMTLGVMPKDSIVWSYINQPPRVKEL